jgi:hypothetical protein
MIAVESLVKYNLLAKTHDEDIVFSVASATRALGL